MAIVKHSSVTMFATVMMEVTSSVFNIATVVAFCPPFSLTKSGVDNWLGSHQEVHTSAAAAHSAEASAWLHTKFSSTGHAIYSHP